MKLVIMIDTPINRAVLKQMLESAQPGAIRLIEQPPTLSVIARNYDPVIDEKHPDCTGFYTRRGGRSNRV